jgi:hypothetical protein
LLHPNESRLFLKGCAEPKLGGRAEVESVVEPWLIAVPK